MDAAKGSIRQRGTNSFELRAYGVTDPLSEKTSTWTVSAGWGICNARMTVRRGTRQRESSTSAGTLLLRSEEASHCRMGQADPSRLRSHRLSDRAKRHP
jgi:hypothetical protein